MLTIINRTTLTYSIYPGRVPSGYVGFIPLKYPGMMGMLGLGIPAMLENVFKHPVEYTLPRKCRVKPEKARIYPIFMYIGVLPGM